MQGINFTNSDKTSYTFQLESTMKSYLKSAEKRSFQLCKSNCGGRNVIFGPAENTVTTISGTTQLSPRIFARRLHLLSK